MNTRQITEGRLYSVARIGCSCRLTSKIRLTFLFPESSDVFFSEVSLQEILSVLAFLRATTIPAGLSDHDASNDRKLDFANEEKKNEREKEPETRRDVGVENPEKEGEAEK